MPIIIMHGVMFFMSAIFFFIVPHFVSLQWWSHMFIFVFMVISCWFFGFWITQLISNHNEKIRDRQRKRFLWYHNMGLFESGLLVEPKYAKKHWKLWMSGIK